MKDIFTLIFLFLPIVYFLGAIFLPESRVLFLLIGFMLSALIIKIVFKK